MSNHQTLLQRARRAAALLAIAPLVATACGSDAEPLVGPKAPTTAKSKGWIDGEPKEDSAKRGGSETYSASASASDGDAATAGGGASPIAAPSTVLPSQGGGGLRAGSVDDNARFDDYLTFRTSSAGKSGAHDVDVTGRRVITVLDAAGTPVTGALVKVTTSTGATAGAAAAKDGVRTRTDGRALFLPAGGPAGPWTATATWGTGPTAKTASTTFQASGADPVVRLDVPAGTAKPAGLDVQFVLDATGSMGDELDRLTTNIASVADRVRAAAGGAPVRFGLTAYRDHGDAYVTRTFDLTADTAAFKDALAKVKAGGGGDTPEALAEALHEAVTKPSWGGPDTAKVALLVADAAPHLDKGGDHEAQGQPDYAADAQLAHAKGIRIHTLASSGLEDTGEFVFRQLAQLTLGKFVFLTYGADGVSPGDTTTHDVKGYETKSLDDLVATLLEEELRPGAANGQGTK